MRGVYFLVLCAPRVYFAFLNTAQLCELAHFALDACLFEAGLLFELFWFKFLFA